MFRVKMSIVIKNQPPVSKEQMISETKASGGVIDATAEIYNLDDVEFDVVDVPFCRHCHSHKACPTVNGNGDKPCPVKHNQQLFRV